jgi:hypothetical protein
MSKQLILNGLNLKFRYEKDEYTNRYYYYIKCTYYYIKCTNDNVLEASVGIGYIYHAGKDEITIESTKIEKFIHKYMKLAGI